MKTKMIRSVLFALSAFFVSLMSLQTHAAGPLLLCDTNQPFLWPNGGANVPFNPDQGGLGILTNAQAVQAVNDSFQAWEDVDTATISYSNQGLLPVDVDATNFGPFLEPAAPDGLSAIVFDEDGSIFDILFGPGSGILGFASPEWINPTDCTILEGFSFLNGPAIGSLEGLLDLMVHEFGHYSNLAHTEVNGQLFIGVGDSSGPGADNTFGFAPFPDGVEVIETMYPFLFGGIDQISRTPHADDMSSISQLYPEPDFAANSGTISGTITFGSTKITGVNIIARNIADPFTDAVSAISSDFTDDFSQANPVTGTYTIRGLTPGAEYAVYVDEILAGGFSTPLSSPLPGPEEFYNGANESNNPTTDIFNEFEAVMVAAGSVNSGIDIEFNIPAPGDPLPTGDDGSVEIPLPFEFCVGGQSYSSAFINGNGFLTLGSAAEGLTFIENTTDLLSGPPRIAGLWTDLSPNFGGSVSYGATDDTFSVTWDSVPEFFAGGSNTFTITLKDNSEQCTGNRHWFRSYFWSKDVKVEYGEMSALNGIAGVSGGSFSASGFETEIDISETHFISMWKDAAIFEQFNEDDFDLANDKVKYRRVGKGYFDRFEYNNSLERARKVRLPLDTSSTLWTYSSISPAANDIDFYRFKKPLEAGTTLVADIVSGQVDTVMALYKCDVGTGRYSYYRRCTADNAELVAFNDDSNGLLSSITYQIPEDGVYVLAVTFCCDYDFDGDDPGQGGILDEGRYVLQAEVIDGVPLGLTDESFAEVELGFDFNFQGTNYSSVFVNSNGYLTFGSGETFAFTPNVPEFENGLPRIAPLWADLNPSAGGMVISKVEAGQVRFTYMDVPEWPATGANTFSVTLKADGSVNLSYGDMTATAGLSGVAEGGGAVGVAVDLSTAAGLSATGTTYEEFTVGNDFDLGNANVDFQP